MESKRIYPSTQLIVALDAKVLKVYLWILSWTAKGDVKYYPKQFAKACKMEENEVDRCIQTLIDCKLLDVSRIDQTWMLSPNVEQNQKYYSVPISKVIEGKGIQMADKVNWNKIEEKKEEDSDEDLKRQILMLQARLKEREQTKKMIVTTAAETNDADVEDLPF